MHWCHHHYFDIFFLHHFPPALHWHWQAGERQTKVTFLAFATTHQLQNNFGVCWNALQIKICLFNWHSAQTNHFFEDISPLFGVTWTCQQFSFIGKVFFFAKENCDFICRQLHSRKSERWKDLKDYVPKKCFLSPGGIFQTFSKPASHRGKKLTKNLFWTCKEYKFASSFFSEDFTHDTKSQVEDSEGLLTLCPPVEEFKLAKILVGVHSYQYLWLNLIPS